MAKLLSDKDKNFFLNRTHSDFYGCLCFPFSARKNAEELKKALETVVVPMFCNASMDVTEEQMAKLNKVNY